MLSKTATYWLAGIGVVGVAAVTPAILKHYHVWPGAAETPAPLLSLGATTAPAAVSPPAAAPAATAAAPAGEAQPNPAQQPAAPDKAARTAVASNNPVPAEPQAAAPAPAAEPAPPAAPAAQPKSDPQRPAFDVVRVEPTGDAVIAGRASPRAAVQLRSDGRVVAQVNADESGQFAILPPPFSAGGHRLQLAARSGGASEVLSDAIGIDVPGAAEAVAPNPTPAPQPSPQSPAPAKPAAAPAPKPVEAARSEAPAPKPVETARSEAPTPPKAAPPPEAPKAKPPEPAKVATLDATPANRPPAVVSILSVEASGTGRFEAKGAAEPNAVVRLYLNNAYLADATVGSDGRWSLTVERGMTPGAYAIRADEIDRANGAVVARAEAPFNYPDRPAAQVAAATPPAQVAAATPPAQDQAAPSASNAAAPAPQPAATPQAAPAPQAAEPIAKNEAPQTPTPPAAAATASEQPKSDGTDLSAKTSTAPAPKAGSEAVANPPPASTQTLAAESPVAAAEPAKPADSAHPVIPDIRTAKVVRGDNLWNLSKHFYGDGPDYKIIYEANASQIRNPRLIYPNQIFVVPRNPPQ
jgi:hypothetical protein